MRGRRRALAIGTVAVVVCSLLVAPEAMADWDADQLGADGLWQHHVCGAQDLPEGDVQGHIPSADQQDRDPETGLTRAEQGYNCGLALVSHATLDFDGRPPTGNANMAWAGDCAYVAGANGAAIAPQASPNPPAGAGVAVVHVDGSGTARHVGNLRAPGALATAETIHAVTTSEGRSILVVGQYGNDPISGPKPMDVYDVTDCVHPRHVPNPEQDPDGTAGLATYYWPENIHNLTISGNGRYVFATIPTQAADISGLFDDDPTTGVTYLGNIDAQLPRPPLASPGPVADIDDPLALHDGGLVPRKAQQMSHEAWMTDDASALYLGAQQATGEILSIVDLSDWLDRDGGNQPAGPPRLLSQRAGRGHSIRTATIDGDRYLLHSEESVFGTAYGCVPETANPFAGPAQPWLTRIQDPTDPELVSQMGLAINEPEHCAEQLDSQENDSVHYHDVDDPDDTTFVMASMWNAGIRIFDVRHPERPTEVGYFTPGDVDPADGVQLDHAWAHVRFVPERGQIWFTTADGGFWVVRIEGGLRQYLDLDQRNRDHGRPILDLPPDDPGRAGTIGVHLVLPPGGFPDVTPYYCTLGSTVVVSRPEPVPSGS